MVLSRSALYCWVLLLTYIVYTILIVEVVA
jgi:hypothetical protein